MFAKKPIKLLFILVVLPICFLMGIVVYAQTAAELQQNINNKTTELKKLEKEANRIKLELSKVGSEKATLNRELAIINGERKSLENNISQTQAKIKIIDSEIKNTRLEINSHNTKLSEQSQLLGQLLRKIHQNESYSFTEQLFSLRNVSDFFLIRDWYENLQDPINQYTFQIKSQKKVLAKNIDILADKQEVLSLETNKLSDQKSIVSAEETKKKNILTETRSKESLYQKNLNKTLAMITSLDAEIRDYESKLKFVLDSKSLPVNGSATFGWPLDSIYITQRFGKTVSSQRLYVSGSHSGVDFRAAVGTPVYAVGDGVIKGTGDTDEACPKASFGKWVFIEHTNGLSTTYGHLSLVKVTAGQTVKRGDLIAYSGNTGHSTAPHLHITVYATKGVNGEQGARITDRPSSACVGKTYTMPLAPTSAYLDPLEYLPSLSLDSFKHN